MRTHTQQLCEIISEEEEKEEEEERGKENEDEWILTTNIEVKKYSITIRERNKKW